MSAREFQRIAVIGAGAWGTALASVARRAGRDVVIWAREPEVVSAINDDRENTLFLPDVPVEDGVTATGDMAGIADADAVLLVAPAQHVRAVMSEAGAHLKPGTPVVICAKGIEIESLRLMNEVVAEAAPHVLPAALSGPSFARDVARGLPTAVTLACSDAHVGEAIAQAIGTPYFRPYLSRDVVGVELGGAVKNVIAIGCGIVDGKGLGDSARAALMTRGLAEIARLGRAAGAEIVTLMGLSGLGDLTLTCNSRQSRNFTLGFEIGHGRTARSIIEGARSVFEGAHTAQAVVALADKHGIDMPISRAVDALVNQGADLDETIAKLLSRPVTSEWP